MLEAVEFATLEWVDWFNHRRLLEPIGNIPPAEAEAAYYAQLEAVPDGHVGLKRTCLRETRYGSATSAGTTRSNLRRRSRNPIAVRPAAREQARFRSRQLSEQFPELPKLDERGAGVIAKIPLGQRAKAHELGIVLAQEAEIRGCCRGALHYARPIHAPVSAKTSLSFFA